jgi:Cu-processing system ATP-binding protein
MSVPTPTAGPNIVPGATADPAMPALEIASLRKRFGRTVVLDGLDATIAAGRVTALVGPNAAGKSTLLKCILGLVRPDAGTIRLAGETIARDPAYRAHIGYMPQRAAFPDHLTGDEALALLRRVRGPEAAIDFALIERFGLARELRKPVHALSGGTRQKLNAVAAYLFRPSLVILDEPSAGLDPFANGILKHKILDAASQGATHIVTSHVLSELEEVAEDVLFVTDGRVRFSGSLDGLRHATGEQRLERAIGRLMAGGAA